MEQLAAAVHDLDVLRRLRSKTIGVVGAPSDWLVASMPDPKVLKAVSGSTEGEILRPGDEPDLCRTQVELQLQQGAVAELLSDPLGNHLVMISGHHADRLRGWWKTMVAPREGDSV